jgi:hypothetical protein
VSSGYLGLGFDPVPGDARRAAALAESFAAAARHTDDARGRIAEAVAASEPWHGTASDEFRRSGADLSSRLAAAHSDGASRAAEVLFEWAATLADLRLRAEPLDRRGRDLRSRIADAEQVVEEWVTAVSVSSTHTRPAAEATLAGHRRTLDGLRAELSSVLESARRLAGEHDRGAERTAALLRALTPAAPPVSAGSVAPSGLAALMTGLSGVTRGVSVAAGLTPSGSGTAPPVGAVAVALAAAPAPGGGTWVFEREVPVERLAAAFPAAGGRRRDQRT